jgi:hypothetical protein
MSGSARRDRYPPTRVVSTEHINSGTGTSIIASPPRLVSTEHGKSGAGTSIIAPIVMILLLLGATILCLKFCRCNRQDQEQDQAQEDEQEQDASASPAVVAMGKAQRKAARYAEVESWLISRRIETHDEICEKALTYLDCATDNPKELKHGASSVDTIRTDVECGSLSVDEEMECPVCMDALEVGDLVSWSPNAQCQHVFHHGCIKEWLLQRKCCPCCRQIFLPAVNEFEDSFKSKRTEEVSLGQQQLAAKSFFCISHGVVTLSKPELCFTKKCELEQMIYKVHCVPSQAELAAIRGCRLETIENSCRVDGCVPLTVDLSEGSESSTALISHSIDEELAEPDASTESTDDSTIAEAPTRSYS